LKLTLFKVRAPTIAGDMKPGMAETIPHNPREIPEK